MREDEFPFCIFHYNIDLEQLQALFFNFGAALIFKTKVFSISTCLNCLCAMSLKEFSRENQHAWREVFSRVGVCLELM